MRKWVTKNNHKIYKVLDRRSNAFLIEHEGHYIIIDTSTEKYGDRLIENINQCVKNRQQVKALVLTHAHFDHVQNAAKLKAHYGTEIIAHKEGKYYLEKGISPVPKGSLLFTKGIMFIVNKIKVGERILRFRPVKVDKLVNDSLDLKSLGINARIIHTPGHTEDAISIIVDNEIALVGDAMFGIIHNHIYLPYATDTEEMVQSWGKLLESDAKLFLPAHGSQVTRAVVAKQYTKYKKIR